MKKMDPLVARIEYKRDLLGISHDELAAALRMSDKTLYNRKRKPDSFTLRELKLLEKKLKEPIAELLKS